MSMNFHGTIPEFNPLHIWRLQSASFTATLDDSQLHGPQPSPGDISLHYCLFPSDAPPFSDRLLRTARQLLSTLCKHGQGSLTSYQKQVQLISPKRLQDTYTELKSKHAKRLCDNWVEKTEPSKHIYEDLGIAAFLMELWKNM